MYKSVPYNELKVWQKSSELAVEIYKLCKKLPKGDYSFKDQMIRCSLSIPSNIAEGKGRGSAKDFLKFLKIARGSLYELQTQMVIAQRVNLIEKEKYIELYKLSEEVSKMLNSFISKIHSNS